MVDRTDDLLRMKEAKGNGLRLRRIERRDWALWIMLLIILIALTLYVIFDLLIIAPEKWVQEMYLLKVYLIGFSILLFLTVAYIIDKEILIKRIRKELFEETITLERLESRRRFAQIVTQQLRESFDVLDLAIRYLKSKLKETENSGEIKHLKHIEEEIKRIDSLAREIIELSNTSPEDDKEDT